MYFVKYFTSGSLSLPSTFFRLMLTLPAWESRRMGLPKGGGKVTYVIVHIDTSMLGWPSMTFGCKHGNHWVFHPFLKVPTTRWKCARLCTTFHQRKIQTDSNLLDRQTDLLTPDDLVPTQKCFDSHNRRRHQYWCISSSSNQKNWNGRRELGDVRKDALLEENERTFKDGIILKEEKIAGKIRNSQQK
jgi:hypothetical protein